MTHRTLHLEDDLTDEQLKKALEKIFDNLVLKMKLPPEQNHELQLKKDEIIQQMFTAMVGPNKDRSFALNDFKNPALLNKVFVNFMVTALHEKHFGNLLTDKMIKDLQKLNPKFDPKQIHSPKDLEKFFPKEQLALVKKILTPEIMKKWQAFNDELRQTLAPLSMKPDILQKKMDEAKKNDDVYAQIFCVISPGTEEGAASGIGSYAPAYYGSGMFSNVNPNVQGAAIDNIDNVRDDVADPLSSLDGDKIAKHLQAETFSDHLVDEMLEFVVADMRTPKLHREA